MTEDEAKTKWCPFTRCGEGINRTSDGSVFFKGSVATPCIGSVCMAWRWETKYQPPISGYCGLAGKVELIS